MRRFVNGMTGAELTLWVIVAVTIVGLVILLLSQAYYPDDDDLLGDSIKTSHGSFSVVEMTTNGTETLCVVVVGRSGGKSSVSISIDCDFGE